MITSSGETAPRLVANGVDRTNQVLIGPHTSGDAVHNDSQFYSF